MFICISDVLSSSDLSSLRDSIGQLDFEPGARTAGWHARTVKANLQAAPSAALKAVQARITRALERHEVLGSAALPARIAPPLISRYRPGDTYGLHVDDALIGDPPLRSDLSLTLFLSDSESYDGGALVVAAAGGEEAVKLAAGSAVLYPSTSLHRVEPVRRGERLVAVTWIQSLVRDEAARETLFDLERARRAVFESGGKSETFDLLAKCHANLLRRWAEP